MNSHDLLDLLSEAGEIYVPDTLSDLPRTRRLSRSRMVLIAAAVGLMLFLLGCAVVTINLQNMRVGEKTVVQTETPQGEKMDPAKTVYDVIVLNAYNGSPNHLASQEWFDFTERYGYVHNTDEDEWLRIIEKYGFTYGIDDQTMVDELERIAGKYDLKLLGPETLVQKWQYDAMLEAMDLTGLCRSGAEAAVKYPQGRMYAEGGFMLEFSLKLTAAEAVWPYELAAKAYFMPKEYFFPRYTYLDIETADQWMYTTAGGTEVLLIFNSSQAIIVQEREDAFFTVTMMTNWFSPEDAAFNRLALEQIADVFDYTIQPEKPDMDAARALLEAADRAYEAQEAAKRAAAEAAWDKIGSWEEYFSRDDGPRLAGAAYYALRDFNGDGVEELILSDSPDYFREIFTIAGGDVCYFSSASLGKGYLCEGNVIEYVDGDDDFSSHVFYTMNSDLPLPDDFAERYVQTFTKVDNVEYDRQTDTWAMSTASDVANTVITEEEAYAIINSYTRIMPEMKPISQFPMEN